MPADYGQTLDGVRALLPHRSITTTSTPTEAQVTAMLNAAAAWVEARTQGRLELAEHASARPLAGHAVELYAAAQAEDATFPERADRASSSYGSVLWDRFRQALEDLLGALGLSGEAVTTTAGAPAYAFPEPLFTRARGF